MIFALFITSLINARVTIVLIKEWSQVIVLEQVSRMDKMTYLTIGLLIAFFAQLSDISFVHYKNAFDYQFAVIFRSNCLR